MVLDKDMKAKRWVIEEEGKVGNNFFLKKKKKFDLWI